MKTAKNFNFYGRRRGKKLSNRQNAYLMDFLPTVIPAGVSYKENPNRSIVKISDIFLKECPLWLEIGFGGGEHLLYLAKQNNTVGFIGCEPYVNGIAMFLPRLAKEKLLNVRVFADDARILFEVLPDLSVTKLFLLFPDPWPKTRHKQRRFINEGNLKIMKRILKIDALIYIATDVNDYVKHALEIFSNDNSFEWLAESANDWRCPWKDWKETRYHKKANLSGRKTTFLIFKRI